MEVSQSSADRPAYRLLIEGCEGHSAESVRDVVVNKPLLVALLGRLELEERREAAAKQTSDSYASNE